MGIYNYALLLPSSHATEGEVPAGAILGIEVTEPALAQLCALGNIDPQHDGSCQQLAAIELALTWPLPPPGATLATIRPDLDAFGAMALLEIRACGRLLTPSMKYRIAAIAKADRFDRGPWPGRQSWPASAGDLERDVGCDEIGIVTAAMKDNAGQVVDRVRIACEWIANGGLPMAYARRPQEQARLLWHAIDSGRVQVDEQRAPGRMAEIVSEVDGALRLGYRLAPVVLALNPRFRFADGRLGPKYTLAQYRLGHADLDKALASIDHLEAGWGGSATIKGSPQGHPSVLDRATVATALLGSLSGG